MDIIKKIHQFLASEIDQINQLILINISAEEELIELIGNHIANSGGKRIRPILTLLSAKMFSYKGDNANKFAAAVEFIHMATLLHDDVVDGSKMRRFLPSANVVWGSKASILVGDFLFSKSFKLMVDSGKIEAMRVLSNAATIIAQGEVSQLAKLEEHRIINEEEYFKIINDKTAELFSSACKIGAIIANKSDQYISIMEKFGRNLGKIFQITDDLLDYFNEDKKTGKNTGDDFLEGKITLPIILLEKKLSDQQKAKLSLMIKSENRSNEDFIWVKNLLIKYDIDQEIFQYLKKLHKDTKKLLEFINVENDAKKYLKKLVDFATNRIY